MSGLQRLPGIDGLRAIAVSSVIAFHCSVAGLFEAGFLGVDIFFTISGFLISSMLLSEYLAQGGIGLGEFYRRRARRLLPPVIALLLVLTLLVAGFDQASFPRLREDLPWALVYASNWWQIFSEQSYFEAASHPALLQHLWSLAVEEQYYIVWPLLFWGLLRWVGVLGAGRISLLLALCSSAWMGILYVCQVEGSDTSRVYLGTDTHLMGLLSGSALACFWHPWQTTESRMPETARRLAQKLAPLGSRLLTVSMLVTVGLMWWINEAQPGLYLGGFQVVALLTCAMIVGATSPVGWSRRQLERRWVQWIGTRSYSLYLVHWPLAIWIGPAKQGPGYTMVAVLLFLVLTGLAAEASYRWVEQPFRQHGMAHLKRAMMQALTCTLGSAVSVLLFVPEWFHLSPRTEPTGIEASMEKAVERAPLTQKLALPVAPPAQAKASQPMPPSAIRASLNAGEPGSTRSAAAGEPAVATASLSGRQVMAIGDSVLLGASHFMGRKLPGILVDARTGRQASEGARIVHELNAQALLRQNAVLHLGTNGYIFAPDLRRLLKELVNCSRVVLVTVRANRRWTESNNELIHRMAAEFPNVKVVDWSELSKDRPDYFVSDGVHLTSAGISAYVREIQLALGLPSPTQEPVLESPRLITVSQRVRPVQPAELPNAAPTADGETPATPALVNTSSVRDKPAAAHADAPAEGAVRDHHESREP